MSDYLKLSSLEIIMLITKSKSKKGKILNERQCRDLLDKFQESVEILQRISNGPQRTMLNAMEEELHRLVMTAKVLVEECCKEDWCWAALMQMNNKESFRELLSDLECCFHTFCSIIQNVPSNQDQGSSNLERCTFYPTSIDEVEKDRSSLQNRLSKHLGFSLFKPQREFMRYVLQRLEGLQIVEGGELDNIIFPVEYPRLIYDYPPQIIGGQVVKAHWQGLEVAVKVIKAEGDACKALVLKEAGILGGLSHPNIINFLLCGFVKDKDTFELVMELGLESLSSLLNKQKESLKEAFAIDIMLQIASGMWYLHDMNVAHRDLKPDNVIVTATDCKYIHVKLIDFGISKIGVENALKEPTLRWQFGTPGFIAPESIKKTDPNSLFVVDALKADVFSFGMLCYVILSRRIPFIGFNYYSSVQNGKRPKLPAMYSKGLKSMIEDCWCFDPSKRPTFLDIHNRLTTLKTTMLKDSIKVEAFQHIIPSHEIAFAMVPNQGTFTNFIDKCYGDFVNYNPWFPQLLLQLWRWRFTSIKPLVNDNMSGTLKLIGHEDRLPVLERQLESHGGLGIIGMGGIGKSTLANALSDHISHKFDAICFVDDFNAGRCTFTTKYKSKGLEELSEVKTLKEGRKCLQQIQDSKKILIVLDNVSKRKQLKQLLDKKMFQNVGGSKLIASSRDWKSLKGHIRPGGKVNMWTLDGEHPMELFLMHAFASNQPCLPYLKYIVDRIVEACKGLPLSLKVMGGRLRGETRLRIWERALHRLLRARQDEDPNLNIWKTLRISFDELKDEEKNMFLDIACFFCRDVCPEGVSKKSLFRIYDKDIKSPSNTLQILINKSLLEVDENDVLDMHDQLRDMGRMLAETEFKGTRIWNLCLSTFTSSNHKGMKSVQGLSFKRLEEKSSEDEANWELETMEHLRLLSVRFCDDVHFIFSIVKQCTKLKWLNIHFQVQHKGFAPQRTFDINMLLIDAKHNLTQLKVLEVHNCEFIELSPDSSFKMIPLKELSLMNCKNITAALCHMTTLLCLRISRCEDFGLCKLVALEELNISKCKCLKTIFGGFENLTCLKRLYMRELEALEVFPPGISKLVKLEELDISKCKKLKKIPEGFGSLIRLKKLYMWECEDLEEFPTGLSKLSALEELDFSRCKTLKRVPKGFESLKCLKKLYMWGCEALESFPNGLNKLTTLEDVSFSKGS